MKEKKKKTFNLASSNEEVNSVLNNMKSNSKVYLKLITGLQLLGNFEWKTEIDFYDKIDDDKEKKIRLWCTDSDDNLFVFYGYSSDRTDLLKITKETNEETLEYDLTLAKKFALNSNNINFTRSNQIYGFKFGRLITDSNNFYSLFLKNDIGYQIEGNFNENLSEELLTVLNKFDKTHLNLHNRLSIWQWYFYCSYIHRFDWFHRQCILYLKEYLPHLQSFLYLLIWYLYHLLFAQVFYLPLKHLFS